jgi:hypothetical protein
MAEVEANCWLIADAREPFARLIRQFADLRGVPVRFRQLCDGRLPLLPSAPGNLIAITAESFERLALSERERMRSSVEGGAVLYLRDFEPGRYHTLQPFTDERFLVIRERCSSGYQLSADPAIPSALHEESSVTDLELPTSDLSATPARVLLFERGSTGKEAVSIFAFRYGKGLAIYDLVPSAPVGDGPILFRFADAAERCANLGPLIAIDSANGRANQRSASFNLVVDDRPADFDYFSCLRLRRFLNHLEARFQGVHVDFAWTPNRRHPSHRYVSILKDFNCGFVWHGCLKHIDHNKIPYLTEEFAAGKSAVHALSRRFGVRFQPIMIFPFERSNYAVLSRLLHEGFLASVEGGDARPEFERLLPGYLKYSTPTFDVGEGFVPILRRYPMKKLTRQMMLALATLGYPIIAAAHPGDVLLRRFTGFRKSGDPIHHFDRLLDFAAEKRLNPSSLEQIASSLTSHPQGFSNEAVGFFASDTATHDVKSA